MPFPFMLKNSRYRALFIECQMKGEPSYHVSLWFTDVYSSNFLRHISKSQRYFCCLGSIRCEWIYIWHLLLLY